MILESRLAAHGLSADERLQLNSCVFDGTACGSGQITAAAMMAVTGTVTAAGYALLVALGLRFSRDRRARAKETYWRARAEWQRAIKKWKRLYYCHRDDVLFDAARGSAFSPSQMRSYIAAPE